MPKQRLDSKKSKHQSSSTTGSLTNQQPIKQFPIPQHHPVLLNSSLTLSVSLFTSHSKHANQVGRQPPPSSSIISFVFFPLRDPSHQLQHLEALQPQQQTTSTTEYNSESTTVNYNNSKFKVQSRISKGKLTTTEVGIPESELLGRIPESELLDKRKATPNHTLQQPLLKKLAVDGTISSMPPMSMPSADGSPAASGESGGGPSTSSGQVSNESATSGNRREKIGGSRAQKTHTTLAQAWKEDVGAGRLLASLFDLFGERILSFIQPSEMPFFLHMNSAAATH